ncbi:MAG TPA: hypothetical protein VMI54_13045 [Polyangiaceae bacterium]|nr:hypothetical protein [Polyangiaceae bacterium]
MPDIGSATSNYVSDGEIIAWLEQKSNEQYGQLDSMMFASDDRSQLTQDLTNLQADIDGGKSDSDVLKEMQAVQQRYAGTSLAPEVDQLLLPMEVQLAPYVECNPSADTGDSVDSAVKNSSLPPGTIASLLATLESPVTTLSAEAESTDPTATAPMRKDFSTQIKGETDKLGRIDQLDLINIQQLVSDARQTDELGSNILASRDQTSNAIVGNIRG